MKRLIDAGIGIDGIRALRAIAEREVRGADGDGRTLEELALRLLYARKAFNEVSGTDEDHFPDPMPRPPHERDRGGPEQKPKSKQEPKRKPKQKPPHERHGHQG